MKPPYLQRPEGTIHEAGPSSGGFYARLYLEHLSEASFLYEQRLALLDDPELTWPELDDFEQRLEAHIDALVLGEDLALDLCRQRAVEGDVGECHTALRVVSRRRR